MAARGSTRHHEKSNSELQVVHDECGPSAISCDRGPTEVKGDAAKPDSRRRVIYGNAALASHTRAHAQRYLINRTIAGRIPMWTSNYFGPALLALLATLPFSPSAQAADLNGAWASDSSVCNKVFVKNANKISMTPDSELYGGGFIVNGNRAKGSFQKCNIKSMKRNGGDVHLIAACTTGVAISDLEFTVKFVGDNQITVISNGAVNLENPYVRCPL
jgi:hypothetical protein